MTRTSVLCLLIAVLTALGCGVAPDSGGVEDASISAEELAARIAKGEAPLILDVRTPGEFESGHLPGARNIPHDELAARLGELAVGPGEEIVVHCQSGRRASAAEAVLREAGYTRVRDLEGHFGAWKDAGLPTE